MTFVLLTESVYNNKDNIFDNTEEEIFQVIIKSNKKKNATIFKNNYEYFNKIYNTIKGKYECLSLDDIDRKIDDNMLFTLEKQLTLWSIIKVSKN